MRLLAYLGVFAAGLLVAVMFFDPFSLPSTSMAIPPLSSGPAPGDYQPRLVLPTVRDRVRHNTIANCVADWDPGTHLTEQEWRGICERTLQAPPP